MVGRHFAQDVFVGLNRFQDNENLIGWRINIDGQKKRCTVYSVWTDFTTGLLAMCSTTLHMHSWLDSFSQAFALWFCL